MAKQETRKQVAVVVYPGLALLDLIGTVSALGGVGMKTGFHTFTVGASRDPLASDTPMKVVPQGTFAEAPTPYALIVPGGAGVSSITAMGDETLLAYVRAAAENAAFVGSVGAGSLILAAAGLLKGRRATTHWAYRRILENLGATYVQQRWIEDGKYITSGGSSGGIDMALYLVGKDSGRRSARQVQLWIEYDPQPPFGPIDRQSADEDALASILAPHEAKIEQALAGRPDLLAAVRNAITGTTATPQAGIKL